MGLFKRRSYISLNRTPQKTKVQADAPVIPDGKWLQCPSCHKTIYQEDLGELECCPLCNYHFRIAPRKRIAMLTDSFEECFSDLTGKQAIDFPGYDAKLKKAQLTSGEQEAVVVGLAQTDTRQYVLCVMNPYFMMGSMGQIVGEKITLAFEEATNRQLPIVICTASGGARMQEGILSLMQMAKISGAVEAHHRAGLLYVTVLTDPTTGGVTASFAMQGDIILSEPRALVGFAGKRVIEQTMKQELPDDFQLAETVQQQGFIDAIVERAQLREIIAKILKMHPTKEETL